MDFGLKGRRALVMGGTKGLGRSIADALAEEGAALVVSGRDQGRLDEAATALLRKGGAGAVGVGGVWGVDIRVRHKGAPPKCTASEMTEAQLLTWFQHIVVSPIRIASA